MAFIRDSTNSGFDVLSQVLQVLGIRSLCCFLEGLLFPLLKCPFNQGYMGGRELFLTQQELSVPSFWPFTGINHSKKYYLKEF